MDGEISHWLGLCHLMSSQVGKTAEMDKALVMAQKVTSPSPTCNGMNFLTCKAMMLKVPSLEQQHQSYPGSC